MKCPRCQHENEAGAKFCEECAAPLARVCARCGRPLSPTAKFCPECAHPTGLSAAPPPGQRFDSPESYTPKHLAEKILTSKSALEGERKQVTVLFADLKGSMELLADRDPEEARKLLDPVLERMMEAVHHYEGTVNQVMGERTSGERLEEQTERLAHHALRGELWDKAFGYLRQAGARAMAHLAPREAVPLLEQALEALRHLPETETTIDQAIETRIALRSALFILNEHGRVRQLLAEATALAEKRGDRRRLGQILHNLAIHHVVQGDHEAALDAAQRALVLGDETKDPRVVASAYEHLGLAHCLLGNYDSGVEQLRAALPFLKDLSPHERFPRASHPAVAPRRYLAWCLAERGDFAEARAVAEEALAIAKSASHAFSGILAQELLGYVHFWRGDLREALGNLKMAFGSVESAGWPAPRVVIGGREAWLALAYAELGRIDDALAVLDRALDRNSARTESQEVRVLLCAAQAYLTAGHGQAARDLAARALASSRERGERGHEALARWLSGEIADRLEPRDAGAAEAHYAEALTLAEPRGMRPLVAHCHAGLAKLHRRAGKRTESDEHFAAATSMYREMGMTYWLEKAAACKAS